MVSVKPLTLGALQTNCYILFDDQNAEAVIVDPADEADYIRQLLHQHNLKLQEFWITHAHFDHIGAANQLAAAYNNIPIALHPDDLPLWNMDGGAPLFGLPIKAGPDPQKLISHGSVLNVGRYSFEVKHIPGHTPGHVIFYCAYKDEVLWGASARIVHCFLEALNETEA